MCREMKDSGIEWIGKIPKEWEVIRTKNIYSNPKSIVGDKADNYDRLALTLNGVIKRSKEDSNGLQPEKFEGYQILKENELVFKLIDLENVATSRVGLSPYTGLVSPAYIILDNEEHSKFGYYYFISMYYQQIFNKLGGDGVRSNLNAKDLLNIPYLNIIEEERIKISNYLDKKVFQINDIISKQKILIEKYKDYKQSIITETVTKGLNKNVPMKDSGIEWNREIPVHWNVIQSKNLFSQRKDRAKEGERQLTASQKYGVIYQDEYMKLENQKVVTVDKGADILKQVEPNDFVISMRSFQGGLEYSSLSGSISSAYVMLIPNKKVYPPYFRWLFKSIKYINALQSTSNLVRDGQAMRYSNFKQIPLFEIPIEEQQEIAEFLDNRCKSIDSVISKKEQLIEKLESYKKSLIYECVTGKRVVN